MHPLMINDLPPELLASIFDAYAGLYRQPDCRWLPRTKYDDLRHLVRLPTELGSVCRIWKDIAYSTPSLWNTLFVGPHGACNESYFDSLEARIPRAGGLTISLYVSEPRTTHQDVDAVLLLQGFIDRYSHRWCDIQIDLEDSVLKRTIGLELGASSQTFTSLRELYLGSVHPPKRQTPTIIRSEQFPRLRFLALSEMDVYAVKGNWRGLTTLDLHHVYLEEVIFVLNNTSNLIHLRIGNLFREEDFDTDPFTRGPLSLPHLKTLDLASGLELFDDNDNALALVLANVQAPVLQRLRCMTTHIVPCPWRQDSSDNALNVLIPSPGTSCPDIIIVGESTEDESTAFDLNFVRKHAPDSHIAVFRIPLQDLTFWDPRQGGTAPLWADWSSVCPTCFLHESGDQRHQHHTETVDHYCVGADDDARSCDFCRLLKEWETEDVYFVT